MWKETVEKDNFITFKNFKTKITGTIKTYMDLLREQERLTNSANSDEHL